jgi:osmotically-inducible protein OsmY
MAQKETKRQEEIKRDVYSQLIWDGRVNESAIDVDVLDGKVVLTGAVPTYSDLLEAEEDAYAVSGVRHVENRLKVSPAPSYPVPGDDEIASKLKSLLQWNQDIDAERIDIAVDDGLVTLMGTVDSIWQKYHAEHIAENVPGVLGVGNRLVVHPIRRFSDEDIRLNILSSLDRNASIDTSMVNIYVKHGIVTLSGTVADYQAYRTAEEIARYTNGVVDVNNNLVIA